MIGRELDLNVELIPGSGGVYDLHADGALLFSRRATDNRFPEDDEVLTMLRARLSQ